MKEIVILHNFKLNKGQLKRDVTIRIMLPNGYHKELDQKYPVLYMMDGQNLYSDYESLYGESWKFTECFKNNALLKLIVVGIDNAEGFDILDEYSPWTFSYNDNTYGGKANDFIKWITEELKPWIDSKYRTLSHPDFTAIGGSGMGGLLATYAVTNYPNTFSRAATLSSAYWVASNEVISYLKEVNIDHIKYWYIYVGTNETNIPKQFKTINDDIYTILKNKGLEKKIKYEIIDGGTHNETYWAKMIPSFIKHIYQDLI